MVYVLKAKYGEPDESSKTNTSGAKKKLVKLKQVTSIRVGDEANQPDTALSIYEGNSYIAFAYFASLR